MKTFTLAVAAVLGLFAGTRADAAIQFSLNGTAGSVIKFEQIPGRPR